MEQDLSPAILRTLEELVKSGRPEKRESAYELIDDRVYNETLRSVYRDYFEGLEKKL